MKQIVFIFSFILIGALSAQAQCNKSASASKACCASKKAAAAASETQNTVASVELEAMVPHSEDIMKRTCEVSGTTTYYQKSVNNEGVVSWEEVTYDAASNSFTKVASASMEKDPATGEKVKTEAKACCSKAKGTKACAGQESKAGCSKKEGTK